MKRFVRDYTDNTGLHGAPFLKREKYILLLCAAACASFGLWECQKTFKTFLLYNVKTKVERKDIEKTGMNFPAITFTSAMQLRNTAAGSQGLIMMVYTAAAGMSFDRAVDWQRTCYDTNVAPLFPDIGHIFQWYNFVDLNGIGQVDSDYAVRQCSNNMKRYNCSRQFLNKCLDSSFGFTFNSDPAVTESYPLLERLEVKELARAYGTTGPERMNFTSYLSGRRAGLQFVMQVLERDYCAAELGAQTGIMAVVHDPSAEPINLAKAYVMLGPGFVHNVALHMKKTVRKTESYGYCKSHLYLKYYNATVDYVSKDKYIVNCLTDVIIKQCNCIPYYAPPKTGELLLGSNFHYETGYKQIFACIGSYVDCQLKHEKLELSLNGPCFRTMPLPCEETKFTAQVTSSILAPSNSFPSLLRMLPNPREPVSNLKQFRHTFIVANFYIGSSTYLLATEQLAMTRVDLMNSLGGAVGMAVGMSLITLMELISLLYSSIHVQLHQLRTRPRPSFHRNCYIP